MCVLLQLLIFTALRAHIIVVGELYKINYYNYLNSDNDVRKSIMICEITDTADRHFCGYL